MDAVGGLCLVGVALVADSVRVPRVVKGCSCIGNANPDPAVAIPCAIGWYARSRSAAASGPAVRHVVPVAKWGGGGVGLEAGALVERTGDGV